jgi:hypothetical protein
MIGGVWRSAEDRDSGSIPVVVLHHEPPFTQDADGRLIDADDWFDALLSVLASVWERLITRLLGLAMVGAVDEPHSAPAAESEVTLTAHPVRRAIIPPHIGTTVRTMAPPALPIPRIGCLTL